MAADSAVAGRYADALRGLFQGEAPDDRGLTTRGDTEPSATVVADRVEGLLPVSDELGEDSALLVQSGQGVEREVGEIRLLAQANAELRVAERLFDMADDLGSESDDASGPAARVIVTRGSAAGTLSPQLDEWADLLASPADQLLGIARSSSFTRGDADAAGASGTIEALRKEVETSLDYITRRAAKISGRAASDLLLMDKALLTKGIHAIGERTTDLLDRVVAGLGGLVRRLLRAAAELVLRSFRWVLSLLGDDVAKQLRDKLDEWIGEIKENKENEDGIVTSLVRRLYGTDAIQSEVDKWLDEREPTSEKLAEATERVRSLADGYKGKTELVDLTLTGVAVVAKFGVAHPPLIVVLAALRLALLGYTVYLGYDHVDSDTVRVIPDRVDGVREVVAGALNRG